MTGRARLAAGLLLAAFVGAAAAGGAARSIALSIAVPGTIVLVFPGFVAQALCHLSKLTHRSNIVFIPWLLLYLSGLVFRIRNGESIQSNPLDGWAIFRILTVVIATVVAVNPFFRSLRPISALYRGTPALLLAFGCLGFVSTLWAVNPSWTVYKSYEFTADVIVMLAIASGVRTVEDYRRFFDWTWVAIFGVLATVWIGAIVAPQEAFQTGVGAISLQLTGVFPVVAANGVGEAAAILAVVCLVRAIYAPNRICYATVFVLSTATLVLAQTRSALAGFVGGLLAIFIAARKTGLALMAVAMGWVLLAGTSQAGEGIWKYLRRGQDAELFNSLSGRTDWWSMGLEKFRERPILGWGAFGAGRFVVLTAATSEVSTVHNDYLEVALGTGLVGLAILIAVLCRTWYGALLATRKRPGSSLEHALKVEAMAVLSLLTIRSMFSTTLMWHPPLPFLLIVGYGAWIVRRIREREAAAAAQCVRPVRAYVA